MSVIFVLSAAIYVRVSIDFYTQERWAWAPEQLELSSFPATRHPEATLALIRDAFESDNFSEPVLAYVLRSLEQVPSSYQASFLLSAYHGNRLEEPELTMRAFESALTRYPANGRLHLAYSSWLLASKASGLWMEGGPGIEGALSHLGTAVRLEPGLARNGLTLARRYGVPPESWIELVPEEGPTRLQLLLALAEGGYHVEARRLLEGMLLDETESNLIGQASKMAFQWGDHDLALRAAQRWQEEAGSAGSWAEFAQASLLVARVYVALGEPEAAFETFREALEMMPASLRSARSELICGMAYEYLRGGQAVMAESLFAESLGLAPRHVPAYLGLARAYWQLGDRSAAMEQYQKVLRLAPRNEEAKRELERLILERAPAPRAH